MSESKTFTLSQAWRAGTPHRLRVLLADDDADLRRWVAEALRETGAEVTEVGDGHAALERFHQTMESDPDEWFDVVIADHKMPRLTGLSLLSHLRSEDLPTPFILMTAFRTSDLQDQAGRLGAWTVLQKPVDVEALQLAVCDAV